MIDVLYDMETQDPDDLFALAILASHPQVNLRGVCVTPGSLRQIGLVRHVLQRLGKNDIHIGAFNSAHPKDCVSSWWVKFLGDHYSDDKADTGWMVYDRVIYDFPDTIIITGGPVKNLGAFLRVYDCYRISKWVAQGGFAGDNVVPPEYRLDKFNGKETCVQHSISTVILNLLFWR